MAFSMWSLSKKDLFARSVVHSGCNWLLHQIGTWQGVLVLNYHRIGNPTGQLWDHELWSASAEQFDWQIGYLKQNFDVIGGNDLEHVDAQNGRCVLITFDDGYRDNYELAYPILKSHGVSATFFLATGFLDHPSVSWWDEISSMVRRSSRNYLDIPAFQAEPVFIDQLRPGDSIRKILKTYKNLPADLADEYLHAVSEGLRVSRCNPDEAKVEWMTWDMVREMDRNGMFFGGHTVHHPILGRKSMERQEWEISTCKQRIETELEHPINSFSYPVGGPKSCTPETIEILRKHGFRYGFRFGVGFQSWDESDPLQIPRMAVELDLNATQFQASLELPQLFS